MNLGVFITSPHPSFDNLLGQLTELRKMLYLLLKLIIKDTNEQLDEEVHSTRFGMVLSARAFGDVFANLEALWASSFRIFFFFLMEVLLQGHNWLNYWPFVIWLNFQLLSPPGRFKSGTESFNPPLTWLIPLEPKRSYLRPTMSHLINIDSDMFEKSVS